MISLIVVQAFLWKAAHFLNGYSRLSSFCSFSFISPLATILDSVLQAGLMVSYRTTPRSVYRLNPAENSICGKADTKSPRKVLRSSPWARHSSVLTFWKIKRLLIDRIDTYDIYCAVRKYDFQHFGLFPGSLLNE